MVNQLHLFKSVLIHLRRFAPVFILTGFFAAGCSPVQQAESGFPESVAIRALTSGPKHHFASAYYHTCSWNASERYLLCLETDVFDHNPTENEAAALGMIDLKTGEFIKLTETLAWNFQQGTMQHWLGTSPDSMIIFNDRRNGNFVSVKLNIFTGEERVIGRPVSAVANNGKTAVSINFARLHVTRLGYGYPGDGDDPKLDETYPADDGLFLVDLETGESKLIVSLADIRALAPLPPESEGPQLWLNHTLYNLDDTRVFFMARIENPAGRRETAGFTVNIDGSELRCILPYSWGASHYDWLSPEKIMVTTRYLAKPGWLHTLFTDGGEDYRILGPGILQRDGHGAFSADERWMVTDSYPDHLMKRTLMLLDMENDAVMPLGRFHVPEVYEGPHRCDLHPGFNHSGNQIVFDSVHEGTRQVYLAELNF